MAQKKLVLPPNAGIFIPQVKKTPHGGYPGL